MAPIRGSTLVRDDAHQLVVARVQLFHPHSRGFRVLSRLHLDVIGTTLVQGFFHSLQFRILLFLLLQPAHRKLLLQVVRSAIEDVEGVREGALPRELHLARAGAGPLVGALVAEARELHNEIWGQAFQGGSLFVLRIAAQDWRILLDMFLQGELHALRDVTHRLRLRPQVADHNSTQFFALLRWLFIAFQTFQRRLQSVAKEFIHPVGGFAAALQGAAERGQ
mmetsp:Transcript_3947/g.6499  ORF Transcript_3947/g.6499 Transcript_3947/m.6499 type:complete len:222 (-) Transcript_3947:693-1358(-)